MNINDVFPSKYLKATDLKGRSVSVVIASCELEQMGDQKKLVLHFQNKQKGMVVNRTNADRIAYMYSPDTDGWIGKEIEIYPDMVTFQGRSMEALRVRPPQKRNGGQAAVPAKSVVVEEPPPAEDDPFDERIPF